MIKILAKKDDELFEFIDDIGDFYIHHPNQMFSGSYLKSEFKVLNKNQIESTSTFKPYQKPVVEDLTDIVNTLVVKRNKYRLEKNWSKADQVRQAINRLGYEVMDGKNGTTVRRLR